MDKTKQINGQEYVVVSPYSGETINMLDKNVYFEGDVCLKSVRAKNIRSEGHIRSEGYIHAVGYIRAGGDIRASGYIYADGNIRAGGYLRVDGYMHAKSIWFYRFCVSIHSRWNVYVSNDFQSIGFGCHDMKAISEWDALLSKHTVSQVVDTMGQRATEYECAELIAAYNYAKARIPALKMITKKPS